MIENPAEFRARVLEAKRALDSAVRAGAGMPGGTSGAGKDVAYVAQPTGAAASAGDASVVQVLERIERSIQEGLAMAERA